MGNDLRECDWKEGQRGEQFFNLSPREPDDVWGKVQVDAI